MHVFYRTHLRPYMYIPTCHTQLSPATCITFCMCDSVDPSRQVSRPLRPHQLHPPIAPCVLYRRQANTPRLAAILAQTRVRSDRQVITVVTFVCSLFSLFFSRNLYLSAKAGGHGTVCSLLLSLLPVWTRCGVPRAALHTLQHGWVCCYICMFHCAFTPP